MLEVTGLHNLRGHSRHCWRFGGSLSRASEPTSCSAPPRYFSAAMSGASSVPLAAFWALALGATAVTVIIAALAFILPAQWNARRAIEARLRDQAGRSIAFAERVALPVLRQPASRAVFMFILVSLARSRRHALVLATYLGIGVAVAGVRLMRAVVKGESVTAGVPTDYLLSTPLLLTFFLVVGMKSAFAAPTSIDANWTFRIAQPRSIPACIHGVAVAMGAVAMVPVILAFLIVTMCLWDVGAELAACGMHVASGLMLIELALARCEGVPFTRSILDS